MSTLPSLASSKLRIRRIIIQSFCRDLHFIRFLVRNFDLVWLFKVDSDVG